MPFGEARRFANRNQFTTGAAFGIQNHGLQSLGNTISTAAFRVFTQRPCGSPVNGGRHRVKRRSCGRRRSCASLRRCYSCVSRLRCYSCAINRRCSCARHCSVRSNAAPEPNTAVPSLTNTAAPVKNNAVPRWKTAAPEPNSAAIPGSVTTVLRWCALRSVWPRCERPASPPIGLRTTTSRFQTGYSFPCWPTGRNSRCPILPSRSARPSMRPHTGRPVDRSGMRLPNGGSRRAATPLCRQTRSRITHRRNHIG